MNIIEINQALMVGDTKSEGVLPHLDNLKLVKFHFHSYFGLDALPEEPGIIMIRGPRQYGKSTWLESQVAETINRFGPGSALYLNGDELIDVADLVEKIRILLALFPANAKIKRLFIDEITAIEHWEKGIKRLADAFELKNILLVTTGSKATDLRRGFERLPGRKGRLARNNYIFTPISYCEFLNKCGDLFSDKSLFAYILSGGSPIAINELATVGRIPEFVTSIVTDWIYGEFAASGRSRANLLAVLQSLYRMAGTPVGQAKLARESGLANNSIAQGYIELLSDLMTVIPTYPYDFEKHLTLFRKPCKYHFTNLLMALSWHPKKPRTIDDLINIGEDMGSILEWLVAQELWRRTCIHSANDLPDFLNFWQSKEHEVDFVMPMERILLEVKSGKCQATNFIWFLKNFHKQHNLIVLNQNLFTTERIKGITFEEFLLSEK